MKMFKVVAAAIALGGMCSPLSARAQESPQATLTVTGQGLVSRAPDLATLSAAIVTNDDNAARALSENNRRFAALGTKLGAIGIAAGDISSTSIQTYFNPRPSDRSENTVGQLFGFVVTRNVRINVNALAQAGAVVDAATAAGATQINGVSYGFRDRGAVERAALAVAVTDAYAQAQAIATAAHLQIVRILRIGNEAPPNRFEPMPMMMKAARAPEAPVPTTISPSDLEVSNSVTITYVVR